MADGAPAGGAAGPAAPDPEEGLSWVTRLMMMLMILPTAAPDPALHQGDWKERLERFNAASDESEDEVRIRGIPRKPRALLCEG